MAHGTPNSAGAGSAAGGSGGGADQKHTIRSLQKWAASGTPFPCLTCYDATTARWLERAGIPLLLVGDTAAETILGLPSTVHMPLDVLLALTAAVKRGAPNCVVMGDMPFLSYSVDRASAMRNAGRFLTEGLADVVKLEADASHADLVREMTRAGIPVCGHVGYRPQTVGLAGVHRAAGRSASDADRIVDDAMALERAGAVLLLVEAVPGEVAERIVEHAGVPVIGIGAGPAPHGQIVVLQDLLGLTDDSPAFVPRLAEWGQSIREAARRWSELVASRSVTDHRYRMLDSGPDGPRPTSGSEMSGDAAGARPQQRQGPPAVGGGRVSSVPSVRSHPSDGNR
ncbi:MAG: 3-methyl-2-oxobutanoate hydroxymethyltransferase [Phycisphaerales bacterium]